MGLLDYLQQPFAQNALVAAFLIAVISGVVGPFVVTRGMAFAVHGTAELSFTGAAAGLFVGQQLPGFVGGNPIAGALVGAVVVASAIGLLGSRERERDSAIGVVLAFGLGVGVYLLSQVRGFATQATNILFGQVFGISTDQLRLLAVVAVGVLVVMGFLYRPLLFASVDPDVAVARGVRTRLVGLLFLYVLALTVTEAAQVVGTLLVLSLAITPAAAAQRLTARPGLTTVLSVLFAVVAAVGGLLAALVADGVRPSVFVTSFSFVIYVVARLAGLRLRPGRRPVASATSSAVDLQE